MAALPRWSALLAPVALASITLACGAVYPELSTPLRTVPPGFTFDPPPPPDLLYIEFNRAQIPERTRDGRAWDSVGGSLPDAFAKFIVNDGDLIVTPVHSNTLSPNWPNQKRGNYRIPAGAKVRVELWDSNPINNHPICSEEIRHLEDKVSKEQHQEIQCESGAFMELTIEPAHGKIGLGLSYEIRTDETYISRVFAESPAARAGVQRGDQIVGIMGEPVKGMPEGRVRSLINSNGPVGLQLRLRARDKTERDVVLKDGPVYGLLSEDLP